MTSKRFLSGAVIVGVLSAAPAFAQHARQRNEASGNRGDQGGNRGGTANGIRGLLSMGSRPARKNVRFATYRQPADGRVVDHNSEN